MRIIAGNNRGRKIKSPSGLDTRPTLDRVKEAVFSSLGGYFDGGILFDPFAGSGAIGLEGLSRGMDFCVLNDTDKNAYSCIKENVSLLKEDDRCLILRKDYREAFKEVYEKNYKFDWIYLDPPYRKEMYDDCFKMIKEYDLLNEKGIIIAESLKEEVINSEFVLIKQAIYGIRRISYFKRG